MEKLATLHEVKRETLDRLKELSEFNLSNFIEIAQNAMQSRYLPSQVISFKNLGICLSYMGTPIIASGGSQTESGYSFLFTYATMQTSSMSMTFHKMIVYPDLSITAASELMETAVTRLPLAVNGKKFTTADEITLVAGDIQAESGWSPTDDKDIATKKYVDEHGGGGSSTGIVEKVLEIDDADSIIAGQLLSVGMDIGLYGDYTAANQPLHNAIITGVEAFESNANTWLPLEYAVTANASAQQNAVPTIFTHPLVTEDITIVANINMDISAGFYPLKLRIHYIQLSSKIVENDVLVPAEIPLNATIEITEA